MAFFWRQLPGGNRPPTENTWHTEQDPVVAAYAFIDVRHFEQAKVKASLSWHTYT